MEILALAITSARCGRAFLWAIELIIGSGIRLRDHLSSHWPALSVDARDAWQGFGGLHWPAADRVVRMDLPND